MYLTALSCGLLELMAIKERGFATLEATFKDVKEDVVAANDDFPHDMGVDSATGTDNIDADSVESNVIDLDVAEPIKGVWGLFRGPAGDGSVEDKSIRLI